MWDNNCVCMTSVPRASSGSPAFGPPGEWFTIAEFTLPKPENSNEDWAVDIIKAVLRERLNRCTYHRNFQFRFEYGTGALQIREEDSRDDLTRYSLSISKIHQTIRDSLAEIVSTDDPPPAYVDVPRTRVADLSKEAGTLPPQEQPASWLDRFKRLFRAEKPEVPKPIEDMGKQRLFQFLDRNDQIHQLRGLADWLAGKQSAGILQEVRQRLRKVVYGDSIQD